MTAAVAADALRPRRRDAVRNHDLVVAAARAVIGEAGIEASMEMIAARAGVGIGTVYRHFPSKEALIDELVHLILTDLLTTATHALERGDGTGLEIFLRALGRSLAEHRSYMDKLVGRARSDYAARLRVLMGELLVQAQEHHVIGAQVTPADIMATAWGMRGVVETSGAVAPTAWERHLDIHLAGLRAPTLPTHRRSVSARQLARIADAR